MEMNNFWETKTLEDMTSSEWESLCDGCGKCCLHKLEDEETDEIYITSVACKLLDLQTCRCKKYHERAKFVPDCLDLHDVSFYQYQWLPKTCAYRLLNGGETLPSWHPLILGNKNQVETVSSYAISENEIKNIDDLEDFVLERQT